MIRLCLSSMVKVIMKEFELSKEAKEDLRKIARDTEKQWGREQRYLYIKQFDDVFRALAEKPALGKQSDFIKVGYRKFSQTSHLIYYREVTKNKIQIVRILHKKMDIGLNFD